jgi:hypothetical protein
VNILRSGSCLTKRKKILNSWLLRAATYKKSDAEQYRFFCLVHIRKKHAAVVFSLLWLDRYDQQQGIKTTRISKCVNAATLVVNNVTAGKINRPTFIW